MVKSAFFKNLNPQDAVMADKGFNIQDLMVLHKARVIAPPLTRKETISSKASTEMQEGLQKSLFRLCVLLES